MQWGPNWEEDQGAGEFPNGYFFYLPRLCNHCSNPACLAACPRQAIYKREEDGIVLIDQERCRGYRYCVAACPYKKIYFNPWRAARRNASSVTPGWKRASPRPAPTSAWAAPAMWPTSTTRPAPSTNW